MQVTIVEKEAQLGGAALELAQPVAHGEPHDR
jgi:hypothetical protein